MTFSMTARRVSGRWCRATWALAVLLGLDGGSLAHAAAVYGPQGVVPPAVPAGPAAAAPLPASLDLVTARLEDVDAAGRRVRLQGRWVPLHPTALRIADAIGPRTVHGLRAGQTVRLALEPAPPTAADRRIVLILVEAGS